MGSLFRSAEMTLAQLYLQSDSAYQCLDQLGELGLVQFRDLNPDVNSFQRRYTDEIRRCDEMERRLRFLTKEIERAGITILENAEEANAPLPSDMLEMEERYEKLEAEIREINTNQERLNRNCLELTELKHIIRQTVNFFAEAEQAFTGAPADLNFSMSHEEERGLMDDNQQRSRPLQFLAGVIHRQRLAVFERLLWRACRGNVFLRYQELDEEINDPSTDELMLKSVFVIFYQGEQLHARVRKICEGFRATIYPCPESASERREMMMGVATRVEDVTTVLNQTRDHRHRVLQVIAQNIHVWSTKVEKMKAIYYTLNLFNVDVTQQCLIGECWCPVGDLDAIQYALRQGHERSGAAVAPILNVVDTQMNPPTYNKVNKFTTGFQNIIDAYGVATYQEVNPAPFSIITFPFLFAVMFGDCGHGLLMFLFALALVVKEKQLASYKGGGEIFGTFYSGRYIILFMGLFSMYTGLLYNDCFSKSFNIFGSSWHVSTRPTRDSPDVIYLAPEDMDTRNPYPFGIDPIWQVAENKLTFTNSYKMKMSVILGVTQMMFGVVLGAFNHVFFKKYLNIFASFIPEVIFLGSLFGYLVVMIIFKWVTIDSTFNSNLSGAPQLLLMLINMFLKFGSTYNPDSYEDQAERLYDGQKTVQTFLVVIAVLAVPWMLLTKPIALSVMKRMKRKSSYVEFDKMETDAKFEEGDEADEEGNDHSDNIGDIFIHQGIHTIEFCLGCVSNTASYLRLWALSLAHAELSEVLWEMMFHLGLKQPSLLGIFAAFGTFFIWAALTIAILLIMEGLSAFLHALRLHWVEFNNKFYAGEGYKFQPFSFKLILEGGQED
ncbi:V-type proton ATPase 116 kDa subunit a 1-like [Sycon ciliatum]|uniref:V-type proton ATPase 116 kDa subunit a 1-like n=1 Tax=Sycon ciliatum TaxID=27933 RepID=UPI0031F662EB